MIYFRLFHLPTFATTLRSTVNSEVDFLFLSFFFFHLKLQDGNQPTLRASDSCDFLSCIYSSKIPSRTLNMQTMTNYNLNESITSPSLDKGKYTSFFQTYWKISLLVLHTIVFIISTVGKWLGLLHSAKTNKENSASISLAPVTPYVAAGLGLNRTSLTCHETRKDSSARKAYTISLFILGLLQYIIPLAFISWENVSM